MKSEWQLILVLKMKTNKEIIDALVEYFVEQDKVILSRILANFMIDFNRVKHIKMLEAEEKKCLLKRIDHNSNSLKKFIENGPSGPLSFGEMNNN